MRRGPEQGGDGVSGWRGIDTIRPFPSRNGVRGRLSAIWDWSREHAEYQNLASGLSLFSWLFISAGIV